MIERLRRLLDGIGYELGSAELLDVLWLARAMEGDAAPDGAPAAGGAPAGPEDPPTGTDEPDDPVSDPPAGASPDPTGDAPAAIPGRTPDAPSDLPEGPDRRHSLFTAHHSPGAVAGPPARAVRAPGPRALPGLHGLARALRPLRAHRDHRHRTVADIEATVRLTAESGVFDVVERPEQELRHTAVLLVDESASMRVWQPLVREVRRLLERGGVFRAVHVHGVDPRDGRGAGSTPRAESPVVVLLTDGVDEAWHGPAARRLLGAWERSGPLIVVPSLPRRLWRGTAFDAQPQLLSAGKRFAPNGGLTVIDPLGGGPVAPAGDRLPVPVVPLSPASLGSWARLLTRPGASQLLDTVMVGAGDDDPSPRTVVAPPLSAEERLDRFRASFSPDAYRLALRLSAIHPLSLPVIQLIRLATLPAAGPAVVAEVLLGDLLTPLPEHAPAGRLPAAVGGAAGEIRYDFQPGVRDLLASGLGTEQSIEVVEAVGRALEPYLGRMPDFAALLADPDGDARLSPGTTAFAVLVSPVLDRLYGGPRGLEGGSGTSTAEGTTAPEPETGPETETGPGPGPAPLRFTVFGPSLAWQGDDRVAVGSPRQQAVLATLLLHEHRIVATSTLVDAVWGEEAPASAPHTVLDHLSRLRRMLTAHGFGIEKHPTGYSFHAEGTGAVPLDLTEAERLVDAARSATESGDHAAARNLIAEALARLEGTPLDGVPGPYAENQRARLVEWRLELVESRIELDLELGSHADIVSELQELADEHPLRERWRAQLMVALYRSGQDAHAVAVYADTRRMLREELGIDPNPELRELHEYILQRQPPELARTGRRVRLTNRPSRTTPSWPPTEGVRFRVLGPVQAWRGGDPLPVGSPQQRALLVALLLRDGRTATVGELIDAIWGEDPPSQALAAVRTYAVRLRKILDPGVLVSDSGGYALRVAPDALDLGVARDLEGASDRARSAGDRLLARDLLTQALDLWEGETLDTVPGPYAESRRTQLEDWRLQLLETRLDLDLEVGAHAEAVSELTALTAAHPLRERLRELLMLALYRSGRQAEALAVYADTRRLLADELGVDPNPELSRLQQRILQADPGLLGDPPDPDPDPDAEGPARPVRPAMLPATVRDFTGRARLVQELSEHLTDGTGDAVCALAGIGGVGKTTLAVHVAHSVRPHFPDGQLYADLQDFGARRLDPRAVLGSFLRALGTPESELTASSTELSARFRAALDGRRILVVLDNALDAAQVRPLLPGTPGCATLVTGRARMVDLEGARLVDLEVMSPEEALQLFTRIVGTERVQSEREAALDTVVACGFLPLAIRIAASRLAARRTWTVSVLAAKLADERRRLDELRAGDLAVKATFELGYGQLEPAQARAFRLLGLADGPDISLAAAATVLDLPVADAEELLEALVDTSFLESAAPGRYRYHDLVRLYARACAERDEQPPTEPGLALSRLLDFYLATASRVYALERPGDRLVDHVARVEQEGLSFTDSHGALEWLYAEAGCLLDCALQSTSPGSLPRAVDLLWLVRDLSESGSHSARYAAVATALNEAADALGDARTAGRSALVLAEAEATLGRFDRAAEWADRVRPGTPPDLAVPSRTAQLRGRVAQNRNRLEEAEAHLSRAVEAFRNDGDRPGEAGALSDLSRVRLAARDVSAALSMTEQAIAVLDDAGRSVRGAGARYARGLALTAAGRYDEARDVFHEARGVFRIHRQLVWEGMTSFRLAETELAAGRPGESAAYAEEALGQLARSGGDWRRGTVLTLLGRALQALDHNDRARVCWQEALAVFEARGAAEAEELRGLLDAAAASS